MNAPLRRVGVVVMVLFGLLFANLNWVQAYKADEYRDSPYNQRVQLAEYDRQRGFILVGGKEAALSKETDDNLNYQRGYPFGATYAHVIGYRPVNGLATGIEQTENAFLAGTSDKLYADRLSDMFTGEHTAGGNVQLTLSRTAQETAYKELVNNRLGAKVGAVVALDPSTGAVLAMVSTPSYDPTALVSHDSNTAEAAFNKLELAPGKPLLNRAIRDNYPPGSTFKVIVSAAALARGDNPSTLIPAGPQYKPPGTTHIIRNAHSSTCPEAKVTLLQALTESCNTGYAQLGVALGAEQLTQTATAFGFYDNDLTVGRLAGLDAKGMPVAESVTGKLTTSSGGDDKPIIAISSIGQGEVKMTPMQGALMASAVANNGAQMRPYLVDQLIGPDLTTKHYVASPSQLRRSCTPTVASQLQQMMISVVENGTGKKAQIDGYQVGGKTGTAENEEGAGSHGWFIGFTMKNGQPVAAVAVFLENAGKGASSEAARIAGRVMQGVIADKGGK